ncbi:hypothetical protein Sps_04347 [Shewanella psychrophila]|uniref:Uncharacterized protein n=1 Tax=Shewanella psychrophila TaxID=225848 RepID=A0A1S6HVJ9_9GAMM|nr:hypothetical protein [Shewanella psychrophila]AQS39448.1 hypothetical protein Sps_04347 [Shewanella psychrophila]
MKVKISIILILLFSISSQAYELKFYANPVPFSPYVEDIDGLLESAVSHNHWTYRVEEGRRYAYLDYKSYRIEVELLVEKGGVSIVPLSVVRPECKRKCSIDQDKVDGWLVGMRRHIALAVTKVLREDALKQISL